MLTDDDLAYMRETQAETRPTPADIVRRQQGATASGGRADTYAAPEPIDVRLDGRASDVPANVTAVVGGGKAVKVTMDLVEVRAGDLIQVSATEVYEVVTDADPDRWATAQVVWTRRTVNPPRG